MKKLFVSFLLMFSTSLFASGIGANDTNAPCDNATLETYSGTANVEINWAPNTINLSWRNGNQQVSGPTTCTYDGALNIPTTPPTRTGYTFIGWELTVPMGYTELEYIESTGTQWIDTGIYGTEHHGLEIEFSFTALNSNYTGRLCGVRTGSEVKDAFAYISTYLGNLAPSTTYYVSSNNGVPYISAQNLDLNKHIISVNIENDQKSYFDNTEIATSGQTTPYTHSVTTCIFRAYNASAYDSPTYAKVYSVKITDKSTLVRNFIPARRNSDNVVGMWDTVTQTFFTNAGSGTFVAGPDM